MTITIAGAGLAGAEAALQLAKRGFDVDLYEMRPDKMTGAHKTGGLAEFVCSNSLGSSDPTNASGLLKQELQMLDSFLIKAAIETQVPAGNALAIDSTLFSQKITELVENNPKINIIRKEVTQIPQNTPVIIASGPLTSDALAQDIKLFTDCDNLYFFDAIAPIVEKDSINFEKAFIMNRYDKGEPCYINCPLNKEEYEIFYEILTNAPKIELKSFEKNADFFESCLPIEVLASRGKDTLRFGPMKPVGLVDKRTNQENWAVIQLRQDNMAASMYNLVGFQTNLKWSSQKELIQKIPGLENANIVRYGVMHRNTFINSPKVLESSLQTKKRKDLFFTGQLTGTEGYTEAIASGLVCGINMARYLENKEPLVFPDDTMIGSLLKYITFEGHKSLHPINSNWGIIKPLEADFKTKKNKKLKNELLAARAINSLADFIAQISKSDFSVA